MTNSMPCNIISNNVITDPILTNANPPLAGLDGFQFSSSKGVFVELLDRGFSPTSEG